MNKIVPIIQTKTFTNITQDIGQVFFATMFLGPLVGKTTNLYMITGGFILSFTFWSISLALVQSRKQKIYG